MDRYKAYLLPGVAALILLAYYVWRWTSGGSAPEPEAPAKATKAAVEKQAEPSRTAPEPAQPAPPSR